MGKEILLVDDSEENIDLLMGLLGDDYELSVAMDGETALELLGEEEPDLVLLDIIMPGMNGFEVFESLKQQGKNIPVIFLSGEESEAEKGLAMGAKGFIKKPFNSTELLSLIQKALT